jgi:dUTP pyrophosphatase
MIQVKVKNQSGLPLPEYQTKGSAGLDLKANLDAAVSIKPGKYELIPTGLYIEIPEGNEAQIRPRSGLALKHGITVLNSPGTIDSDYRGEVKVLLINHGAEDFKVENGDRIAQMIFAKVEQCQWIESQDLSDTERGKGGYGHTGV